LGFFILVAAGIALVAASRAFGSCGGSGAFPSLTLRLGLRCSSQAKSKGDRWNDCPGFLKGKMKWKNSSHAFSLS
jgi:hypothetical protein